MTKLKKGDKAPDFKAKDQDGNPVSLEDYKGKNLVMYFYPKDDTPGCTKESCNLRDNYDAVRDAGYDIIGVSIDNEKSHQKFRKKYNLPFPLIADTDKEVVNQFQVWGKKKFMGREYEGIHRVTFLIDQDGNIQEVIDKVKTSDHSQQILDLIEEM